ncbi:Uncharacterised protein [Mycobacteroides abscessus subsp. abscessus]|nr:Uncharacterised protein [Mycobacteroides abscessus subsp. abscessus]SLC75548.1 Uncharacterised protein [Mycobacteroides abscessus subsp. massiliense]
MPVDPRERRDHRGTTLLGDLEDVAVVEDPQQDLHHVVTLVVVIRDERVEIQIVLGDFRL